jgi:hypothetical protein
MKFLELGRDLDLHAPDQHGHNFNIKRYYELEYGYESSSLILSSYFRTSVLQYFFENFEFIYHSTISMDVKCFKEKISYENLFNFLNIKKKPNFYFKHKDCILVISVLDNNDESSSEFDDDFLILDEDSSSNDKDLHQNINDKNSKVHISIHYPSNKIFNSWMKDFLFLEKYALPEKKRNQVSVLMKNQYGDYDFEPLNVKIPKIDLNLNYGESFQKIYDKIISKISNNNNFNERNHN